MTEQSSLGLSAEILSVLKELKFTDFTPIQKASIPLLMNNQDVLGQSKTGSGKTAAFALPMLMKIDLSVRVVQGLVLCPTRELATQVVTEIRKLGRKHVGLQVISLVGGVPGRTQGEALAQGLHLAVGTPGRVLDLIERGRLDLINLKMLVLDEADKMLEMGFQDELRAIMKTMPQKRQTALFSATFPESILELSRRYQKNPAQVVLPDEENASPVSIQQLYYESRAEDRLNNLMRVLQQHTSESTIIFCNTKLAVHEVQESLSAQNAPVSSLHGDLDQYERDRVMALFRNKSYRILVATDVAARGLDIANLELVINYDVPAQADTYVHRIGRTGRAGHAGTAVTFLDPRDTIKLLELQKASGQKMEKGILGFKNQHGLNKSVTAAVMNTISITGGRKDKLRPGDILGALTGGDAGLSASDIGKIEVQDKISYVAITASKSDLALQKLRDNRIKGKKFRVSLLT